MADRNLVLQLLIRAKDEASAVFGKVFSALNDTTNVIAGKIRAAFTGLFGGALDGAIDFEAQLDKVQAKGQITDDAMAQLRQTAIDLGAKFGISGTEAAQGMESLAAAGLNATQVMEALPAVLNLAKIEGLSMDAASEKLANSLTAVGLGFDQAGRMADVLAAAANASTTSASAVAEALSTAGQIARTAGLTFEETAAALTALAQSGIQGEKAGTALQAILTQLLNPASAASKALDQLGITSRDFGEVIGQLAAKGAASNAAILAFGETAGPGLRALLAKGQQGLLDLNGAMLQAAGSAQTTADTMGTNLGSALAALDAAWGQIKTALLEPVLQPLTQAAKDAATTLNQTLASGALKPVQEAIKSFVEVSIAASRQFAKDFNFKEAIQSISDLTASANESFGSVKNNAITVANAVSLAWNSLASGFRIISATLLETAASAVQTLSNIESVASKVGLGTQERANELAKTALDLHEKAKTLLAGVTTNADKVKAAFDGLTASTETNKTATEAAAAQQARLRQAFNAASTEVERTGAALKAANEEYRNAQARGEELDPVLKNLNARASEYRAALAAQEIAQRAINGQLPETITGMAGMGDAAGDAAQNIAALPAPTAAARQGIAEITAATGEAIPKQKEYADGINYLVKGTGDLAVGVTSGKDAIGTYNKAMLDGAGATATAQEKTALLTAEITRVSEASAAWRQGKELNIVILNSLQNTLESTQAKLALLEARQRAGEQVDNEIIQTKAAVQEAYNRYTQALEANIVQQERAGEAAQRANQLGQQEADLNIQRAQSALELAQIRGDSNTITQAENDLLDAQIAKLQAAEAGKEQEIAAYEALIEATRRKLAFDGELNVSGQNQLAVMADKLQALELERQALAETTQATQDKTRAERDAADAAKAAASAAKAAADAAAEAADKQRALGTAVSTALSAANRAIRDLDGDAEKLNARFNELQRIMLSTTNAQGMAGWMGQIAAITQTLTQEFESQKARLTDLTDTLDRYADTGEYTASVQQAMIQSATNLDQQYTLLNQQDLDQLRAALDSANQKLRAMRQATQDAKDRLAELNAELLEAQGADQKAQLLRQQLSFQQQLAEIEQQRAAAEAAGNRELLAILAEQEATLRRINDAKTRNIEADTASESAGDRLARTWRGAADAVDATGVALNRLSGTDLTRLHTQVTGIAEQAGKLRDAL